MTWCGREPAQEWVRRAPIGAEKFAVAQLDYWTGCRNCARSVRDKFYEDLGTPRVKAFVPVQCLSSVGAVQTAGGLAAKVIDKKKTLADRTLRLKMPTKSKSIAKVACAASSLVALALGANEGHPNCVSDDLANIQPQAELARGVAADPARAALVAARKASCGNNCGFEYRKIAASARCNFRLAPAYDAIRTNSGSTSGTDQYIYDVVAGKCGSGALGVVTTREQCQAAATASNLGTIGDTPANQAFPRGCFKCTSCGGANRNKVRFCAVPRRSAPLGAILRNSSSLRSRTTRL